MTGGLCYIETDLWKTSGRGKELVQKDSKGLSLTTVMNLRPSDVECQQKGAHEMPCVCR